MINAPFFWIGISLIFSGILLAFVIPAIINKYPTTQKWIKFFMFWYHVFGVAYGIFMIVMLWNNRST